MLRSRALRTLALAMLACWSLAGASSTLAAVVTPLSYDLPNGDGQAHGGTFNYWDKGYTGSGNTSIDGATLSGGRGDLTDGVVATQNWLEAENAEGAGPYVGWRDIDPTIVFHFSQDMRFSSITLQADDADGEGGVFAPGGITVGGKTYTFADPAGSTPQSFTVNGLDLVGKDLQITLQHRAGSAWTFVSEVTFEATAVPEASSAALVLAGLMTTVGVLARRKAQPRNAVTFEAAA